MVSVLYTNLSIQLWGEMPSAKSIQAKNRQYYEKVLKRLRLPLVKHGMVRTRPAKKLYLVYNTAWIERVKKLPLVLAQRHDTVMTQPVKRLPLRHDTVSTQTVKMLPLRHGTVLTLLPKNLLHIDTMSLIKTLPVLVKGTGSYALVDPKADVKEGFVIELENQMLGDKKQRLK